MTAVAPTSVKTPRDPYVDYLRGASLLVVVLWHWMR